MPSTANNPMEESGIASRATKLLVEEAREEIGTAASALHSAARELHQQHHRGLADSINQAAQGLEWLAGSLNGQSLKGVLGRAESLARRQPVVFYAGALAAGFLLSRFLKSSAPPRHGRDRGKRRRASPSPGSIFVVSQQFLEL